MKKTRLILLLVTVVGCQPEAPSATLTIATDATFAPFHFVDDSGQPSGFDVELAKLLADDAGFDPEVIVLPYAQLFSGLTSGTHDVVAATTGITAERQKIFRFSEPYFTTCQVAVVRLDHWEPESLADLSGRRIGASGSGTSMAAMQTIDAIHVQTEDGQSLEALKVRSIDAWIVDEFDGVQAARESNGRLTVLGEGVASERYGFVIAGNNVSLQEQLNESLRAAMQDGSVQRMLVEFGVNRDPDWPVKCPD
jgi:ABC-type amino acid transport substrate-binding protein